MEFDFATNQTIDEATLGNVPEGYRSAYEKGEDGKFVIAATARPFVDAIMGLGSALKGERNVSKTLKGQKDATAAIKEAFGFDTLDEAKAKYDEMSSTVATASKVDPAKIKADIEKTFNVAMGDKDNELKGMKTTLDRYMIQSDAVSALAAAKGNEKLLLPIVKERAELVKDGDEYVVRIKDGQGDYRGDGKGGFMTVAQLVLEMRGDKDYAAAFESDNGGGTGITRKPGEQQRQQMNNQQSREDMSPNDRIKAGLEARRGNRR